MTNNILMSHFINFFYTLSRLKIEKKIVKIPHYNLDAITKNVNNIINNTNGITKQNILYVNVH